MKKLLLLMSLILIFLAACGDNDEVNNPPQNDTGDQEDVSEDLTDEADEAPADNMGNSNHPYPFTHFELDVDMEDDLDIIEIEYEQEPDETEASYYDRNQDINLSGDEAMERLDEIFSSFTFDESTPKEEVIDAVRTAFDIPDDAKRIEVDLTFLDNTEVEFVEGQ